MLSAPEEGFTVEGVEVGMVVVLGRVLSVEKAATKTKYQVRILLKNMSILPNFLCASFKLAQFWRQFIIIYFRLRL